LQRRTVTQLPVHGSCCFRTHCSCADTRIPAQREQGDAQMREDRGHPSQTVLSADVLAAPLVGPTAPLVGPAGTVGAWLFVFLDTPLVGPTCAISWWMLWSFSISMLRGRYTAEQSYSVSVRPACPKAGWHSCSVCDKEDPFQGLVRQHASMVYLHNNHVMLPHGIFFQVALATGI